MKIMDFFCFKNVQGNEKEFVKESEQLFFLYFFHLPIGQEIWQLRISHVVLDEVASNFDSRDSKVAKYNC